MSFQTFTVSRDDTIYEAWPDLIKTPSGKLLCTFTECDHHLHRDHSRIMITQSMDRGRHWSPKRPVSETSMQASYFNNSRLSLLKDGRLALICDRVTNIGQGHDSCIYLWFSEDEGDTWTQPTVLPFSGIVPDRLRQLQNGRLLICAHNLNPDTNKLEEYLWYSDDNGLSWSSQITLAADPRYNLCEACLIECEDGTLVAFLRENSFEGYDIMKTISRDHGLTWSEIYRTPMIAGHRPTVGYLDQDKVLVSYRFIPAYTPVEGSVSLGMQNLFGTLLLADELTRTKREGTYFRTFPIAYDRNEKPDTGYSGWVTFEDGEIYMVYYIKDDAPMAQIRGCSFTLKDVIL